MDDKKKGDDAIADFERELIEIISSKLSYKEKIEQADKAYRKAVEPWTKKGDERVLDSMRIAAGSAIDDIVEAEIGRGLDEEKLKALREDVIKISWLAEGFKSSIRLKIAFRIADVKMKMT